MNAVLIGLFNNIALLLALGLLYDMLTPQQKDAQTWPQQLFTGGFIGLISIALMLNPLPFAEGVIFDTRSVLLSVSGLFLGPAPTLIAMVMGALFRLYLGGVGVWMGIAVIVITGGMGLAWRSVRYRSLDRLSLIELYAFGLVVHVAMLCCVGLLPGALARAVLVEVGPPVMLLYPVCTALLGTLMVNLRRHHQAAAELHASQTKLQTVVAAAQDAIILIDIEGKITLWNAAAQHMFGYSTEEALGRYSHELIAPARFRAAYEQGLAAFRYLGAGAATKRVVELNALRKSGEEFPVELSVSPLRINDQWQALGIVRDITARKRAEEALRESEERFGLFMRYLPGLAYIKNAEGRVLFANEEFRKHLNLEPSALIGKYNHDIFPAEFADRISADDRRVLESGNSATVEEIFADRVWMTYKFPIPQRQNSRPLLGGITFDITEYKQAEERIRQLAYHDPLTLLPNRAQLAERARLALALMSRQKSTLALLFCDLDNFKDINDSLGHATGDALLTQVAVRLRKILREADILARLGGDEFVALALNAERDSAAQVADRILTALREPIEVAEYHFAITGSVGISLYPHDGATFEILLQNADAAMYRAKQEGRNRLRFYDAQMNAETLARLTLLSELRKAIDAGQLCTYFQPKVSLADGGLVGAEALVRWRHPEEGLIPPGRFIPVAESTDLIVAIGEWVLEDVCRHLVAWRSAGLPLLTVAVNLAARHFREAHLVEHLAALLECYDLPPTALELELTESTLLDAGAETMATIEALQRVGFRLAIDDFGTGYSSLTYLKNLPIASLKIDQSFVRGLESDPADRAIAATVATLGHSLGLTVVAEGVETERQCHILLEQNCDFAQGYLFSRPLPAEAFTEWMSSRAGRP